MIHRIHEKYVGIRRFFVMCVFGVAMLLAAGCAGGYYGGPLTSPLGGRTTDEWYLRTFTATDSEGRSYSGISSPYITNMTDSEGNTIWINTWSVWDY